MSNKRIAVYPGSFDPIHNGHLDIVERSLAIFDELVVGVLGNEAKRPVFSVAERVEMIKEEVAGLRGCKVESFSGLLVDFMEEIGARTIIRGLRAISDFEYEFQMALMNRRLNPDIETVFFAPREEYSYLSSRLVKEVYFLGGNLEGLVPGRVLELLAEVKAERLVEEDE
ncbi:MAG: pantetheine-phosphate adenylyltransferase [Thermoanaerobaculia bacterium]